MIARSLRLRLLAGGAIATAVALALAWLAMTLIFTRHIERRVQDEMVAQSVQLLAGLRVDAAGTPTVDDEPPDPRFNLPTSGLYWQVSTTAGRVRSRSLWDSRLPDAGATDPDAWRDRRAAGPFGQRLLMVERRVTLKPDGPPVAVQFGYDLAKIERAQTEFSREIGLSLALLWLALALAAWLQVTLGLRPIANVGEEVTRLRRDPAARLAGAYPVELSPLTEAIDALADAREADVTRARRRAADLAHGLKTPLAALAAQSARAREAGADRAADGLDSAIAAVRAAVDGELARTRIGLVQTEGHSISALPLIERLVAVVEHTEPGERIAFEIDVADSICLPLTGDDAAELVGPLLENAVRHARRRVAIEARDDEGGRPGLSLTIGDDGPGLDLKRHGEAVLRGARLDSAGDGHGLGLAITRELAEATGGVLSLTRSRLGGLAVRVFWPAR